jgi:hypothetical protein
MTRAFQVPTRSHFYAISRGQAGLCSDALIPGGLLLLIVP